MSREDLHVGSAPVDEDCAQLGTDDYAWRGWHECRALIGQLRRIFGPEPPGSRLYVKHNPHDFGTYLSANFAYLDSDAIAVAYADRLDRELPATWDEDAKAYLVAKCGNSAASRQRAARGGLGRGAA